MNHIPKKLRITPAVSRQRGFSMVEVLLAIFILSIGLIMVATIFPVAADWTRQSVEEGMGANIAQNAVAIIQTKYTKADLVGVTNSLVPVPGIDDTGGKLPLSERAYAFGVTPPYPAANPSAATYFWTAMIRLSPGATNKYNLYIFVFKKGSSDQLFTNAGAIARDPTTEGGIPYLLSVAPAAIPIGTQGVAAVSGTVFRQLPPVAPSVVPAQLPPISLSADTSAFYAPPADGTATSPLIYIYQTTVSF